MTKRCLPLLAWIVVAGLPSVALVQPVGPEFQVNTYTTSEQGAPSVALDATGNFVVVWSSYGQDGSRGGIFGQRYDSGGNALGSEFQVNTHTIYNQYIPSVASDSTGNFVVVWSSIYEGIFGQRYDNDGNPLGGEFRVNAYTTGGLGSPSVSSDASGNFVVVWSGQDESYVGVFGQRYDNKENAIGGEFQVNTYTTGLQRGPS